MDHPSLLAGAAGYEDAGVFRLDSERALVQTTDFFPPIVDDPRMYGQIAAANALSDVYSMGGQALTALNIVGWPKDLDPDVLGEILAGGMDKIREADAALCGGHSVSDHEIKYGLAVTGVVHPERFWRNSGAQLGDLLLLTKPVGMGPVATAIKRAVADEEMARAAMAQMATLNRAAAEALADLPVHAVTDVTGFGLLGHGHEMAAGAQLSLEFHAAAIPVFSGAVELVRGGTASGGSVRQRVAMGERAQIDPAVDEALARLLFDAETSGGLLVAVAEDDAPAAEKALREAGCAAHGVVGQFVAGPESVVSLRP